MRFSLQPDACWLNGRGFFASPPNGCRMQGGQDRDADSAPAAPPAWRDAERRLRHCISHTHGGLGQVRALLHGVGLC